MEQSDIQAEVKKLSNLPQYKDKNMNEDDLSRIAKTNILVREFKANPLFYYEGVDKIQTQSSKDEQKLSEVKFKGYVQKYDFENESDLDTLRSLIYAEVYEQRIQREINTQSALATGDTPKFSNPKLTEQLTEVQNQKLELKVKLGIDKEESGDRELDVLTKRDMRFDKYIEEHYNEFTLGVPFTCPKCNHEYFELHLLNRRVEGFDKIKHPWFAGRWFFNYEIIKDVKNGKITKDDAWRYMVCAGQGGDYKGAFSKEYCSDYIDYCLENWQHIISHLQVK